MSVYDLCYVWCRSLAYLDSVPIEKVCLSSTLRSWLHEISTRIKFCPLDWRTTIHWNVVLAIFQHNHICQDCWKLPDQNLNVWFFSNPGDKVNILVKSTGQICPIVLPLFWTFSPVFVINHTFKRWSGIFPTIWTYMNMLENCLNKHSVYGCSLIQGTKFYSCWNLIKSGSQSWT